MFVFSLKKTFSMKNLNTFLLFLIIIISSCKKEKIISEVDSAVKLKNKSSSSRPLPAGDPNLDVNWDWTRVNWTIYFNAANGTVGSVSTLNPFLDGSQKTFGNVNPQKADMHSADGWMLVSRDFGTPTSANAYPFIILYNKYKGSLRVCILRTYDVLSSRQQITLSYAPNSSYPDLFRFAVKGKVNSDSRQVAITTAGVQEWMIADFDVKGYSESISDFSAFNISMSEIAESNVVLDGNIQLDGTAQPQVASLTTLGQILGVKNFFASTSEAISKVTNSPKATAETLISGGASVFLNSVIKLFTGFMGGGASSTYNIKLKGPIKLNGSITLTSPKTTFSVYLKSSPNNSGYRPLQNIPWGLFNFGDLKGDFNSGPIGYNLVPDDHDGFMEIPYGYQSSISFKPNFLKNGGFKINPVIESDISSIEFLTIEENAEDDGSNRRATYSEFLPLSQFESKPISLGSTTLGIMGLGVKITFKNGIIVYEAISVTPYDL